MTDTYRIEDRYTAEAKTVALTGIQAMARLPIEQLRADRRAAKNTAALISGYPGSPLGGFDGAAATAAKTVPDLPISCRPAVNEELGATAIMGSQLASSQPDAIYDGVVGIWYAKAPGVDRAVDALRHAVYAGTSRWGGAIALIGDDPNAKSSTLPSSSAGVVADLHMPLLYPGDPGAVLDLGRHAIALSRFTGLWSAIKIVADVADGLTTVVLDPDRTVPVTPALFDEAARRRPDGRLLTPHTIDLEQEIYEVRYPLAINYASANGLNATTVNPSDAWLGIVSSGITYREVREALERLGLTSDDEIAGAGIRLLRMQMPIPFDPDTVRRFATGLETLFVIEEKMPNIESLIKDALYHQANRPQVIGKTDDMGRPLLKYHGALDADGLLAPLRSILSPRLDERLIPEQKKRQLIPLMSDTERAPFFCSGCPHNRSTEAPEGSLIGAGIGCHTMTLLMDPDRVGDIAGLTAMGNEGTQWIGMSDFVERGHLIQNLGDGTFFHSGQLAVQASVASGVNITYKLLYNDTVAMTGGQDPQGQSSVADVATSLLATGVSRVLVTSDEPEKYGRVVPFPGDQQRRVGGITLPAGVDVWDRTRLIEAQEVLAATAGTTVLIHDQGCAAEVRRARKRGKVAPPKDRVVINPRICEGCGDCGQVSNCLSVEPTETPFGRKTKINQTTCNFDFSCLEGDCPSFMTVVPADVGKAILTPDAPKSPTPILVVDDTRFAMRITGIGGTGIVTVSQVIGTAAMFDGYSVRGLDQIGLSQKAGPVVSDVRLSRTGANHTNRLGEAQADLLLACDQLVAATARGRLVCSPDQTAVVGSVSPTPTGAQITSPELAPPSPDELIELLATDTRADQQHWADAEAITTALFGDAVLANMFVVGMAVQAGALPVTAESFERAIELNGVAVEKNLQAFAWGRAQISHPEAAAALVADRSAGPESFAQPELTIGLRSRIDDLAAAGSPMHADLVRLTADLIGFQDENTASDYLDVVERVAAAEAGIGSTQLTHAVAVHLHKLTAYKDEYEVARLMLSDEGLAEARSVADGGSVTYRLHPPMLKALGMDDKISIGEWAAPGIRALAKAKRLRGSRLDPFGRAEVRRLERELVPEYLDVVNTLIAGLSDATLDQATRIAALPDQVRGYEDLKLRRIGEYRSELKAELAAYPS